MRTKVLLAALILFFAGTSQTWAERSYSFHFDQESYFVTTGSKVAVSVYLRETVGPNDVALLASDGLFAAGVGLGWDMPALITVVSPLDIQSNPEFTTEPLAFLSPGAAVLRQALDVTDFNGVRGMGGPDYFDLWLGTYTFTAGMTSGATLVTAGDLPDTDDTVSNLGDVLDALITEGQAHIRVTQENTPDSPSETPEPATLTLAALGVAALLVTRRRRFR